MHAESITKDSFLQGQVLGIQSMRAEQNHTAHHSETPGSMNMWEELRVIRGLLYQVLLDSSTSYLKLVPLSIITT